MPSAFHLTLKNAPLTSMTSQKPDNPPAVTSQKPLDLRCNKDRPLNLMTSQKPVVTSHQPAPRPIHYSPMGRKPRLQHVPNNVPPSQLSLCKPATQRHRMRVPIPVRSIAQKYAPAVKPQTAPPSGTVHHTEGGGRRMCTVLVPKRKFLKNYLDSCQGNSRAGDSPDKVTNSVDSCSDPSSNGSSPSTAMTSQPSQQNIFLNLASKVM